LREREREIEEKRRNSEVFYGEFLAEENENFFPLGIYSKILLDVSNNSITFV